jgi:hypothetical protein
LNLILWIPQNNSWYYFPSWSTWIFSLLFRLHSLFNLICSFSFWCFDFYHKFPSLFPEFIDCHWDFLWVLEPSHPYFALLIFCYNRLPVTHTSALTFSICSRFSNGDSPITKAVSQVQTLDNWVEGSTCTTFYCDVFPAPIQLKTSTNAATLQHELTWMVALSSLCSLLTGPPQKTASPGFTFLPVYICVFIHFSSSVDIGLFPIWLSFGYLILRSVTTLRPSALFLCPHWCFATFLSLLSSADFISTLFTMFRRSLIKMNKQRRRPYIDICGISMNFSHNLMAIILFFLFFANVHPVPSMSTLFSYPSDCIHKCVIFLQHFRIV